MSGPVSHKAVEGDRAEILAFRMSTGTHVEVMRTWYRTQAFPRHTHEYFTIGVMLRGIGTLESNGAARTLRRGDVVVIAPGEVHTGGLVGGGVLSYLALHVPHDVMMMCVAAHGLPQTAGRDFGASVIRDSAIAAQLRRVDIALSGVVDIGAADDALTTTIDLLVRRRAEQGGAVDGRQRAGEPEFVAIARRIIQDCYADKGRTSLEALAHAGGVTPFHLVREFTRVVGLSPHRYVVQTRIGRAQTLLSNGMRPSFVAASTGFVDQSHFTTQFRRFVGTTPGSYQRCVASRAAGEA